MCLCKLKNKVYLLLHVDDMILAESSKVDLTHVKGLLNKELGESRKILGIDITRDKDQSTLNIS